MSPLTIALIVLGLIALQGFSLYFIFKRREKQTKDVGTTIHTVVE
jgi:hypothetical protein